MLNNITIATSDLKAVTPDIEVYLFPDETNFNNQIAIARKSVYREVVRDYRIKNPSDSLNATETALLNVKDLTNMPNLKDKIVRHTIAEIFRNNRMMELYDAYKQDADLITLEYHLDADNDGVVDDDDEINKTFGFSFGR
tara:strand:+ start:3539 stop:3958 length:420 start_codon:yes stop_codon:yes gene_type:complete